MKTGPRDTHPAPTGDGLRRSVGDHRLHAVGVINAVRAGGETEVETPLRVQPALHFLHRFPEAVSVFSVRVVPGEIRVDPPGQVKTTAENRQLDLGVRHGGAEVVVGLNEPAHLLATGASRLLRPHRNLVLGLAVLLDPKLAGVGFAVQLRHDAIASQTGLGIQFESAVEGPGGPDGQIGFKNLLAVGIVDLHFGRLGLPIKDVGLVNQISQQAFEHDRVTGPIDRSVRGQINLTTG